MEDSRPQTSASSRTAAPPKTAASPRKAAPPREAIVRLDLRTKVTVLIAMNVVLFLSTSLYLEVFLMATAVVLAGVSGDARSAVRFGVTFSVLVAIELAVVPVLGGFAGGLVMFVAALVRKILPVLCVGLIILTTTEVAEFLAVAAKLHVPKGVTIPLSVAFRYFPTLGEQWECVCDAMRMRGINMSLEHVLVPIMMSAVMVGDELSAAALCRGIDRPGRHTCLREARLSLIDCAIMVSASASVAAILALKAAGLL